MKDLMYIDENARGIEVIPLHSRLLTERKFFLTEEITSETAVKFAQAMMFFSDSDKPVDICINSPGGEINAGLAIYDMIQSFGGELNMYCIGQASSMAAVLLASGQKGRRFILPHSSVMIHEALLRGGVSGSATSISRISESILETRDLVNGILAKHTGKNLGEINKATSFDNLMNAEEAVRFGICDRIADPISERRN
ncbi:MAG: ClpP family protease [Oscillospiraceae bacterium]